MIIGSCPYPDCNAPLFLPIAGNCPQWEKHKCETCKRVIWTYHSRIDPVSYAEDDFLEKYDVNETIKQITAKKLGEGEEK